MDRNDRRPPDRNIGDITDPGELVRVVVKRYWKFTPLLLIPVILIYVVMGILSVPPGKVAIMIRKTGDPPPNGSIVAQKEGQKGIVLEPLPEGLYWKNPYTWDWKLVDAVTIPEGKYGVVIRQHGEDLPRGNVVATGEEKGIQEDVLRAATHRINTLVNTVEIHEAVQVPPGHLGVVTLLAGRPPENPNRFVVKEGEKGVQPVALSPGTYIFNPYVRRVSSVDMRAHRFDMEGTDVIQFPSSDGFPITLVGTIEWYIDRERAAEVFVKYVDKRDVITCIVEKVILPNARAFSRLEGSKHLARDFISGETRQAFQDAFLKGLKEACASQGVLIRSALVRDTLPPEEIATPIRAREIAVREREKYEQEKDREIQEKQLSMEMKLMERKTQVKDMEAQVSIEVTKARENQRVALIGANKQLEVAELELEAAEDQASAQVEKGRAAADVVLFENKAKAAGIRAAREAFLSGETYVRYLYYRKIAPALRYVLSNTDGPFADIFQEFSRASKDGAADRDE